MSAASARPDGSGDAVSRVVYGVTPSGNPALPDLSVEQVQRWEGDLAEVTVAGAAVFGPDHPIGDEPGEADWNWASLAYWDTYGRQTHAGVWGAGQWLIDSTTYHDVDWYPDASLDAGNRAAVFADECTLAVLVCAEPDTARRASMLFDVTLRDGTDPALVTWTLGPAIDAVTDPGETVTARASVITAYDEGAPNGGVAPDTGLPYRLPTTVTSATLDLGDVVDPASVQRRELRSGMRDEQLALTGYDKTGDGESGWTLRAATTTTTFTGSGSDPGDVDAIRGLTIYDSAGVAIVSAPPGAGLGNAATTLTDSYGPWAVKAACRSHYWWAGLPCVVEQAAAPAGGSGQRLVSETTGYTWLLAATTTRTTAGPAVATSTTSYDTAGRVTKAAQTETGTGPGAWPLPAPVPDTTYGYDPGTGLPTTVATQATARQAAQTVTTGYDAWGRATSYTDATGAQSTTSYDHAGRVATETTGAATTSWSYDSATDHRGLPSATTTTGLPNALRAQISEATATTTWDTNGAPTTTGITGIVSHTTVNAAGDPVALTHVQPGVGGAADTVVAAFTEAVDAAGRTRVSTGSTGLLARQVGAADASIRRVYHYDNSDRLISYDTLGQPAGGATDTCTTRDYGLAKDATRPTTVVTTGLTTATTWGETGACASLRQTVTTATDRDFNAYGQPLSSTTTSTGGGEESGDYVYDHTGRVIVTPTPDTTSGTRVVTGYFTDDTVQATATATENPAGQETGWVTRSYGRDPLGRTHTWTDGTLDAMSARQAAARLRSGRSTRTGDGFTQHYSSHSDSPTWAENTQGQVDVWLPAPDGTITATLTTATEDSPGSITLTDLHGDATAILPITTSTGRATTGGQPTFELFDAYGTPTTTITPTPRGGAPNPADTGGSTYGYLYNNQRSRQTTSGLLLMGARLYNPVTGTFTTPDPIPGGNPNPYTYPPDPINRADPSGADSKGSAYYQAIACGKIGPLQCAKAIEVTKYVRDFFANDVYGSRNFKEAGRHFVWNVVLIGIIGRADALTWTRYHEYVDYESLDSKRDRHNNRQVRKRFSGYARGLDGNTATRVNAAFNRFIALWRSPSYGGFWCINRASKLLHCNSRNQDDVY